MADDLQVLFGGTPIALDDPFYNELTELEVEENAELPGAIQLDLQITTQGAPGAEDLSAVGDDRFAPYARIAVVATPDGGTPSCIFDGHVLSHKIHVETSTRASTLRVWGQDVSCLMNLKEVVKPWTKSDGNIANEIFTSYGFQEHSGNTEDDSAEHPESGHALMQRATDAQFLRDRARRNGKLFRVCCKDEPGKNTGYFIKPKLDESAVVTLTLNPEAEANVDALEFAWDVARPTSALAQALRTTKDAERGDTRETGLALLDARSLTEFIGGEGDKRVMEARLTAPADSAAELSQRAASLLREAGWFVTCEGEAHLARLKAVLRVATVVQINGAGALHSGRYFVWSVRHTITSEAHRMRFVMVRNAIGRTPP